LGCVQDSGNEEGVVGDGRRRGGRGGTGLLVIALLALARAAVLARPPPDPRTLGRPIALDIEALRGEDFRLLPGVGPVLAARLEAARVAAGGRLAEQDLAHVPGAGPTLRARWERLRSR
jgi:hypothetical protein